MRGRVDTRPTQLAVDTPQAGHDWANAAEFVRAQSAPAIDTPTCRLAVCGQDTRRTQIFGDTAPWEHRACRFAGRGPKPRKGGANQKLRVISAKA